MSIFKREDYIDKKVISGAKPKDQTRYMKKRRLTTDMKSHPRYCRVCNAKNELSSKTCKQCGSSLDNAMKRPYR